MNFSSAIGVRTGVRTVWTGTDKTGSQTAVIKRNWKRWINVRKKKKWNISRKCKLLSLTQYTTVRKSLQFSLSLSLSKRIYYYYYRNVGVFFLFISRGRKRDRKRVFNLFSIRDRNVVFLRLQESSHSCRTIFNKGKILTIYLAVAIKKKFVCSIDRSIDRSIHWN